MLSLISLIFGPWLAWLSRTFESWESASVSVWYLVLWKSLNWNRSVRFLGRTSQRWNVLSSRLLLSSVLYYFSSPQHLHSISIAGCLRSLETDAQTNKKHTQNRLPLVQQLRFFLQPNLFFCTDPWGAVVSRDSSKVICQNKNRLYEYVASLKGTYVRTDTQGMMMTAQLVSQYVVPQVAIVGQIFLLPLYMPKFFSLFSNLPSAFCRMEDDRSVGLLWTYVSFCPWIPRTLFASLGPASGDTATSTPPLLFAACRLTGRETRPRELKFWFILTKRHSRPHVFYYYSTQPNIS